MTGLPMLLVPGLAAALGLLVLVIVRVVRARNRAERAIVFERELSGDLLEQAAGFDRLVVALAGIADDLDEGHVLARTAAEASRLVEADAGLVLERIGGRLVVTAACVPDGSPAPGAVEAADIDAAGRLLGDLWAGHAQVLPLGAPSLGLGLLAVVRRGERPFVPLELAQLRVLADFAARAAQNARLFALAEGLRAEAEDRERERARLSDRLLDAEENERRRLALALHDGPQQTISGIALMVEAAVGSLEDGDDEEARRILRLALDRNRDVVRSLRQLQFVLEPITLRDHGFTAAFGEVAAQLAEAHGLRIDLDVDVLDTLPPATQAVLYRIAQEAVANVVKHAGAHRVSVVADAHPAGLELIVADDGCGVRPGELDRGGLHRGVDAMRERAAGIGAALAFEPTVGGGTTVRLLVPAARLPLRDAA